MDKKKKELFFDIALVCVPLLILTIWVLTSWVITYQLHDDRYMMEFLAGKFLHYSEAHLIYIKYPLALMLQFVYKIFPGYDWYATTMFTFQISVIGVITWYLVQVQKSKGKKVIALCVFYIVYFFGWLNELTNFTYTTVAAFIGAGIIVVFVCGKKRIGEYILLLVMSFFCYNVRSDVFLMVIPFCGILWIYFVITEKKKSLWIFLGMLMVVIGSSFAIDNYAYSSQEWKEYKEYNKARTLYYDYYYEDIVDYEKNQELYDRVGIDPNACWVMGEYDLSLYDNMLYDKMASLVKIGKKQQTFLEHCKSAVRVVLRNGMMSSKSLLLISLVFWLIAIVLIALAKDKKIFLLQLALIGMHAILWFYLGYRGRIVLRVAHSMLFLQSITALVSSYLILKDKENNLINNGHLKKVLMLGASVCLLAMMLFDVRLTKKLMINNAKEGNMEDHYKLEEYCGAHPENFYFLDVNTVVSCKYRFDFVNPNVYENFVNLGDWYGNSPLYREKLKEKGITSVRDALLNNPNVYIITSEYKDWDFIAKALGENVYLKKVDSFTSDMNLYGIYEVCKK